MIKRHIKFIALLLGTLFSSLTLPVHADDTEIYTRPNSSYAAPPIIMFYMEYTPNLASSVCVASGLATDGSNLTTLCPALAPLAGYFVTATTPGASVNNNDFIDGKIDQFELTRAALKRVLIELKGVKVGLLMAHNAQNNCAGLTASGCSNGAYILKRAISFGTTPVDEIIQAAGLGTTFDASLATHRAAVLAADPSKAELFNTLNGIPSPQGNLSHANQNKEVYFELYRYLAGKPVYNGHNGWTDFATSSVKNIGTSQDTFTYKPAGGLSFNLDTANLGWDTLAEDGSNKYVSPITQNCQKVFVINVVDGGGNAANDSDGAITPIYSSDGMYMTVGLNDPGFVQIVQKLHDLDLANASTAASPELIVNPALDYSDPQNVISFFIANHTSQVDAAAQAGGSGKAYQLSGDPTALLNALRAVFDQIISVSTTFVTASIPVNVFNRAEVTDNAYIALFQSNADGLPRWAGDVKKLKTQSTISCSDPNNPSTCTKVLTYVDANGAPAFSSSDGRINSTALTFWTNPNGYDLSDVPSPSITGQDPDPVPGADGRAVMRGGSGQKLPGFLSATGGQGSASWYSTATGARHLYTEAITGDPVAIAGSRLMSIEIANLDYLWPIINVLGDAASSTMWYGSSLSYTGTFSTDKYLYWPTDCYSYYASSATVPYSSGPYSAGGGCWVWDVASNVVAFMRGYDTNAIGQNSTATNAARVLARRWMFGDPLHSRPLPINYGLHGGHTDPLNPDIRIVVGGNDGYIHMLKNTDTSGNELGTEAWAFMPREVMKYQTQLMDNSTYGDTLGHPYGVDGPPSVYTHDTTGTIGDEADDQVLLFFGLRRGGRAYYAMDITDPDTPKLKWKITNSTPGFAELGYTFGAPVIRKMNWGSGEKVVVIFGGGYDRNKDLGGVGTDDLIGRAVYIVDAETGDLIWKTSGTSTTANYYNPQMLDSIPSEVTAVDTTGDHLVDRIYVGDTGGRVWRIDTPYDSTAADSRSEWKSTLLLELGRHDNSTYNSAIPGQNDRRFFYRPDFVSTEDTNGVYDAIVIGSGNRAHPLATDNKDYMLMYKDRDVGSLSSSYTPKTLADLADLTNDCAQVSTTYCDATTVSLLDNGWMMGLTDVGEKSLSPAVTVANNVYFTTYVPNTTPDSTVSCVPEGKSYYYTVTLDTAAAVFNYTTANDGGAIGYDAATGSGGSGACTDGTAICTTVSNPGALTPIHSDTQAVNGGTPVLVNIVDRKRTSLSGGIGSEVNYQCTSGTCYIDQGDHSKSIDLGIQQWRTYWYEKQK